MAVVLLLATFLVFIVIDALLSRRKAVAPAVGKELARQPSLFGGFQLPDGLRFHPGHTWLMRERKNVIRVGADEFAAAVAGKIHKIELPKPGHWVRQGQAAWSLHKAGQKAEMVSPIEGEVMEVNPEVLKDPSLLRTDPYGRGWLMTVFAPDEESTLRNLLPAGMVRSWMQEAIERLYARQPQLAGAVAADGGQPVEDLAEALGLPWKDMAAEFFLTK